MITAKEIEAEAYLRYPDDEMESWSNERECFADAVRWALDEITNRSDPKADPKEKELQFMKLEWVPDSDYGMKAETPFGWYDIRPLPMGGFFIYGVRGNRIYGRDTMPEAMEVAQDHFNSKLKLCLNREL